MSTESGTKMQNISDRNEDLVIALAHRSLAVDTLYEAANCFHK